MLLKKNKAKEFKKQSNINPNKQTPEVGCLRKSAKISLNVLNFNLRFFLL